MSRYDHVAPFYDLLAGGYSLGGIARAKRAHVALLQAGESVLYAGGGSCAEGVRAARAGARVTVVDRSRIMCQRARARFSRQGLQVRVVEGDALAPIASPRDEGRVLFDHVVVPFFLNVFPARQVGAVLTALCAHLGPQGRLTLVDFRAASRNSALAALQEGYHLAPLALFRLLTANPWHRIHDDRALASAAGLSFTEVAASIHSVLGLPAFESMTWCLTPPEAAAP